ncbi:MAG: hypothetical protein KAS01_00745 [Candidatus Pacebacteria bacterium]|nr:hypothetical protein [Candidatus Paceibacterota bacterium]
MSVSSNNNRANKKENKNSSSFDNNISNPKTKSDSTQSKDPNNILKKKLIEKIKKGAEEKMKEVKNSENIKDHQNLNKLESKKSGIPRLDSPSRLNLLPQNQRIEKKNKINRIKNESQSATRIKEMRTKAQERSEKEAGEALKNIQDRKARFIIKLAGKHAEQAAYTIATKMAKAADDGGIMAFLVIVLSLFLAITKDIIDIGEIELLAFFATIVAIPVVIAIEGVLWFINFGIALINIYFWTVLLGGGHKKWFWKRFYKTIILTGFDFLPGIDVVPFTTLMVLWNISDYYKEKKKAKADLGKFIVDFKSTGKVNKATTKKYIGSV